MSNGNEENGRYTDSSFADQIGEKADRRRRGLDKEDRSIWHAMGTFGMVGWSVAVPTIIGVLLGLWLDTVWRSSPVPWTLVLLVTGLIIGCASAWQWIEQERRDIERERQESNNA